MDDRRVFHAIERAGGGAGGGGDDHGGWQRRVRSRHLRPPRTAWRPRWRARRCSGRRRERSPGEGSLLERLAFGPEGPAVEPDVVPDDAAACINARASEQALRAIEHAAVARGGVRRPGGQSVCTSAPSSCTDFHEDPGATGRCTSASTWCRRWPRWRGSSGTGSSVRAPSRGRPRARPRPEDPEALGGQRPRARGAGDAPTPDAVEGDQPLARGVALTLTVAPLLYKLKVTLTNLAVKFLVPGARRAATRAVLELVAVPVNALGTRWCWLILHGRLRVMGLSAATGSPPPFAGDARPRRHCARRDARRRERRRPQRRTSTPTSSRCSNALRARVGEEVVPGSTTRPASSPRLRALDRAEQGACSACSPSPPCSTDASRATRSASLREARRRRAAPTTSPRRARRDAARSPRARSSPKETPRRHRGVAPGTPLASPAHA